MPANPHDQDSAMRSALKSSVYPGASDDAISQVIAYCRATNLDPMTKPVHIVPQWVREHTENGRKVNAGVQDIVLPGIGLYRTQAHRTRQYAGHDKPEFGPKCQQTLGGVAVTFPEWCRFTVYRMTGDIRAAYSVEIYWLETYATTTNDSDEPELMWRKRPYGQLEKCAEALALRKAFPEDVGSQPTAEEMEGRHTPPRVITTAPAAPAIDMPRAKAAPIVTEPASAPEATLAPGWHVSAAKRKVVLAKAKVAGLDEGQLMDRHPAIADSNLSAVLADLSALASVAAP